MTTNVVDEFSLQNIENFYSNFNCSKEEIYEKYNALFSGYFIFMFENLQVKNSRFLKFIIQRGLLTVTNVFNLILYYSKNMELAYYHGQKAFYFYIEYIGQISEDHHTFLQLSSRDATMFVYKKTIFDVQNEFKKAISIEDKYVFDCLEIVQYIQKILIDSALEKCDFQSINKENDIKKHLDSIERFIKQIIKFKFAKGDFDILQLFIDRSIVVVIPFEIFYQTIDMFIKRYNDLINKKLFISKDVLRINILLSNIEECFTTDTKFAKLFSSEI